MKVTVAINNYNYSKFIIECVDSVIAQTYNNLEILIVDDGSTDNSLNLLKLNYQNNSLVTIISKTNGGQLSAFNETVHYATGDIVCFLDADDLYANNYVEELVKIYTAYEDIDFVYCAFERFYTDGRKELIQKHKISKCIGYSILSTLYLKEWLGSATSTLSMKTSLFKKIFPIPYEDDWRTRADDCLVWGTSIFGAKKYYLSQSLVSYRIHSSNTFHGKSFDSSSYGYKRHIIIYRLFNFFTSKSKIDNSYNLIRLTPLEYKLRSDKSLGLLYKYVKILFFSNTNFLKKLILINKLISIHVKHTK